MASASARASREGTRIPALSFSTSSSAKVIAARGRPPSPGMDDHQVSRGQRSANTVWTRSRRAVSGAIFGARGVGRMAERDDRAPNWSGGGRALRDHGPNLGRIHDPAPMSRSPAATSTRSAARPSSYASWIRAADRSGGRSRWQQSPCGAAAFGPALLGKPSQRRRIANLMKRHGCRSTAAGPAGDVGERVERRVGQRFVRKSADLPCSEEPSDAVVSHRRAPPVLSTSSNSRCR